MVDTQSLGSKIALNQLHDQLAGAHNQNDPVAQNTPGDVLNSFGDILKNHINEVNTLHHTAEQAQQTYATGGNIELHQVMIATERAEMAVELTMQLRNKILAAYNEISHMSV